jgi:hypothetical protein
MHPCDNLETLLRTLQAPRRNRYFYGKRMDVQHFQMEQDYGKLKLWLLNRMTFGKGVVCGLDVSVDGTLICVEPGFAIDGLGREIVVPVRTCIDALTQEGGCCTPCCGGQAATTVAAPAPAGPPVAGAPAASAAPAAAPARDVGPQLTGTTGASASAPGAGTTAPASRQFFTLWACYKECRTDYQPVLVSDCNTREQCAAGTIVESFCLKLTPGLPPLQADPAWCAKLWSKPARTPVSSDLAKLMDTISPVVASESALSGAPAQPQPTAADVRAALASRRELLCNLFDGPCDGAEGDPCVPLAAVALLGQSVVGLEACLVRPRVYSNEVLLDLILCLAGKIDECCKGKQTTDLMQVKSVEFLGADSKPITSVKSPLADTPVPTQTTSIRVTFTQPFDQGANRPTTPGRNDSAWDSYNFQVTPTFDAPSGNKYVPGSLVFKQPDVLIWNIDQKSAFFKGGWIQIRGKSNQYKLSIYGNSDTAAKLVAITDTSGVALDGEPIAPAQPGGILSGDGSPGGNFTMTFTVV